METLNYIGSKKTLFNTILNICIENIPNLSTYKFADLFAGTGTIGFNMNKYVRKVISNDMEYYSYVINYALLKSVYSEKLQNIINNMNELEPIESLIYHNYSGERMFFTEDNAKKCDACRTYLEDISEELTNGEYMFLLASIIVSMDKVANTSCVYGAYLKKFKSSALKDLFIKPIHTNSEQTNRNVVYNETVENLISKYQFDIVYLDPPYNQRQYSSNYSPLNYIAQYDEELELTGKTGLIKNYNKSDFCSKVKVNNAFSNIFDELECKYLLLSYNNEGLLSLEDLKEMLLKRGDVTLYKIEYNKFKAQKYDGNNKVEEYLWFVKIKNDDNDDNENKYKEINYNLIKI